jgi:hypothetical protein
MNEGGCSTPRGNSFAIGLIAVHELLHNFGLEDMYNKPPSQQIPNNYMLLSSPNNNQLTMDQIILAITSSHNNGSNSSNKNEVTDKNTYSTSNSDPTNEVTMSSDGRIPKIVPNY